MFNNEKQNSAAADTDATHGKNMLNERERRTTRRMKFTTAVGGDVAGRHILDYTADISLSGLYIRTSKVTAAPGTPMKITLRVPGMAKRVSIDGFIVRTDAGDEGGLAVRFGGA